MKSTSSSQQENEQQQELQQHKNQRKNQRVLLHQITNKSNPPPAVFNTNKNGLPFETQQALLLNVSRFQGHDDFAKGTCNSNLSLFGEPASKKRKACQDKRRQYIQLLQKDPQKFLQLCAEFDALAATATATTTTTTTTTNKLQTEEEKVVASFDTNWAYRDRESYSSDSSRVASNKTESDTDQSEASSIVSQKKKKKAAKEKMSHRKVQKMIGFGKYNFEFLFVICYCTDHSSCSNFFDLLLQEENNTNICLLPSVSLISTLTMLRITSTDFVHFCHHRSFLTMK